MNAGGDALWLHPFGKMLSRVADAVDQRREFQKQSFLAGASAEILIGGADYCILVPEQGGFQSPERSHALVVIRRAAIEGGSLSVEQIAQTLAHDGRRVSGTGLPYGGHLKLVKPPFDSKRLLRS